VKLKNLLRPIYLARRVQYRLYELQHPGRPWISQGAIRYCMEHLNSQEHIGLEWGSGRSTIWYAEHLKFLTSVEHNKDWHTRIAADIKVRRVQNVNYLLVPLDHDEKRPTCPRYDPIPQYVKVVGRFQDNELDFVVIDGHYRQACVLAAINKIKPGGLLLIDNSNWMPLNHWGVPSDWQLVHQSDYISTQTTIWRKPELVQKTEKQDMRGVTHSQSS
jgi:hypothetical protein